MFKDKKKNKKPGLNPNASHNSPPSDSETKSKRPPKSNQDSKMSDSGSSNEHSPHADRLLSSLRREAMGSNRSPFPVPTSASDPVPTPIPDPMSQDDRRLAIINSQLDNRYTNISMPPYIAFVEVVDHYSNKAQQDRKFIGNLHPMAICRRICTQFNHLKIYNIKRVGRNLLSLTFDSSQQANTFVSSRSLLPKN